MMPQNYYPGLPLGGGFTYLQYLQGGAHVRRMVCIAPLEARQQEASHRLARKELARLM